MRRLFARGFLPDRPDNRPASNFALTEANCTAFGSDGRRIRRTTRQQIIAAITAAVIQRLNSNMLGGEAVGVIHFTGADPGNQSLRLLSKIPT
ncbi:hypothetical protein GCM10009765_84180 [Fodinicola feengrottensis]|uniref:Uncharacterized protein n=1 Tax=Fodinicola feengrottensis TaxID=435914 RepID=A0ABN2JDJ4_9ACTN